MDKQLQLAVNAATSQLNDRALAWSRMQMAGMNPGMDAKRCAAYSEYGFPEIITDQMLYQAYRRHGVANGAVNKLNSTCFSTDPWLIEGDDVSDEARDETQWEKLTKAQLPRDTWANFAEADKRRLAGRYAGLVLRIMDGRKFDQPAVMNKGLAGTIPVWGSALKIKEWNTDETSKDYGKPKMYSYKETLGNGQQVDKDIHPDRVFILGSMQPDAIGFLEPAYNALTSIEKVEGGSGESFLKNAARHVALEFDKEIDLRSIADSYGVEVADLQAAFNDAAGALNKGLDQILALQGAKANVLSANVPDPRPPYDVNLQTACASFDIPSKIIVGNQTGERASTEDIKSFSARCQSRRIRELGPEIRDFVEHLARIGCIGKIPAKGFTVMWDDLTTPAVADKLANAKVMGEINNQSVTGEVIFEASEIRVAAGFEPELPEQPEPLGETEPEVKDPDEADEESQNLG